jgi:hypothetical protein
MMIAALLYAGPDSAIDAADACRFHGIKAVAIDDQAVHVVVPWGSQARSRGFVVVRRTLAPITIVSTEMLRYVDPASAATRGTRTKRSTTLAPASGPHQRQIFDASQRPALCFPAWATTSGSGCHPAVWCVLTP